MNIRSLQPNKSRRGPARHERMAPLATLPVFYKLKGKKVLIAGGSEAAAWKAELLAAAGAEVHVHAERLDPVFADLIAAPAVSGAYVRHQRPWSAQSFVLMQIAICDAESEGEAQAFYCAARAAGVAVNVIDRPAWCEFQFGSIVNRSPAVIAISTDGAAPILGQAIRRRIETLLPPALAAWAQLAQTIRKTVNDRLAPGPQRRAFWEFFVDRAFGAEPERHAAQEMLRQARVIRTAGTRVAGRVTLVGAGPGDAELLTLKAVRALQAADVILFDDGVSGEVLELARREARRMLVGKGGGRDSCDQHDIHATMIALAKAGKHVVRLQGGDPVISGQTGQDLARLQEQGIAVTIVPGIASAAAIPADVAAAPPPRVAAGHSRNSAVS
ncbi:SAM-dependent methyltransferase [Hoeflea ulvae]|uniref:SAM-dependent methyltransferase n=1 Tax=Hoeflea ulvae TaxID=2983764 RepID=UPI002D1E3AD1|nr:SAM-dependent methyltransferase [Hoeflea ulvae]